MGIPPRRASSSIPSSEGPNDKPKSDPTRVYPGEPMSSLGSLTEHGGRLMDKNRVTETAELESLHPAWMKVPTLSLTWYSHFCLLSPVYVLQSMLEKTPRPQKIR